MDCHSSNIREHHSTVLGSGRDGEVEEHRRCMRRESSEGSTHNCAWKLEGGELRRGAHITVLGSGKGKQ